MTMILNKDQIQDLYAFTRKHFVEHYDLQTELVDHLANDIEAIWQEQPHLSFEQARGISFEKFGIYGFMEVVEKRQKAMNKRYLKYLWKEFKLWLTIPKIVTTVVIFLLFYMAFSLRISDYLFVAFYAILIVWVIIMTAKLNRQFRRRKEISDKKWLLEEIIFKQAGGISLILLSQVYTVTNFSEKLFDNQWFIIISALVFTMVSIMVYISFQLLPNKAETLLKETYPEFTL